MLVMVRRVVILPALHAESVEKGQGKSTLSRNTCVFLVAKHKVHKPVTTVCERKGKKTTTKIHGII